MYVYIYILYIHIMSTGLPGHIQGRKPHDHPRRARSIDIIYYPLTDIVIVHIVYINEINS